MKQIKIRAEIYSRVVGYFRPVSQWNAGKAEEFTERRVFNFNQSDLVNYKNDNSDIKHGL